MNAGKKLIVAGHIVLALVMVGTFGTMQHKVVQLKQDKQELYNDIDNNNKHFLKREERLRLQLTLTQENEQVCAVALKEAKDNHFGLEKFTLEELTEAMTGDMVEPLPIRVIVQ